MQSNIQYVCYMRVLCVQTNKVLNHNSNKFKFKGKIENNYGLLLINSLKEEESFFSHTKKLTHTFPLTKNFPKY